MIWNLRFGSMKSDRVAFLIKLGYNELNSGVLYPYEAIGEN